LNLVEFDVGILGAVDDRTSDPPVCARQPCREVRPAPRTVEVLRVTWLREHGTVGGFPEADGPADFVQHDSIEPAPDDDLGAIGCGSNGRQVAGRHPLGAWPWTYSVERYRFSGQGPY